MVKFHLRGFFSLLYVVLSVKLVSVVELPPLQELVLADDAVPLLAHPGAGGQEREQGQLGEHHLQHLRRE